MAKFCMKCGARLEENEKFCKVCGTPVDCTERDISSKRATGNNSPKQAEDVPSKNGRNSKAAITALSLIIIVLCSVGGYFYYQSNRVASTSTVVSDDKDHASEETDEKNNGSSSKTTSSSQDTAMDKAKVEMAQYGIQGDFKTTSYGHSQDGFIAVDDVGQVVVIDKKNHRVGTINPRMSLAEFQRQKNAKSTAPMIMDCTFPNDAKDGDVHAGYWKGNTHYMTIYAVYKFDQNGNIIPGMLTTAKGEHPSHYQEYLYESRNVDFANLFLTEAMFLKI